MEFIGLYLYYNALEEDLIPDVSIKLCVELLKPELKSNTFSKLCFHKDIK